LRFSYCSADNMKFAHSIPRGGDAVPTPPEMQTVPLREMPAHHRIMAIDAFAHEENVVLGVTVVPEAQQVLCSHLWNSVCFLCSKNEMSPVGHIFVNLFPWVQRPVLLLYFVSI
jgi:hypothetical protein